MEEKKSKLYFLYNVVFFVLALAAVYIAVCDITTGCTQTQVYVDYAISVIFIADYLIRLIIAKKKARFFRENILDLIAIIPFSSFFKVFRVFKMVRLLKLLKLTRISAFAGRFYKKIKFFLEINGLKYMVFISGFCIIAGGIAMHFAEKMSIFDGLWWSFVTATTVGYGDLSPSTHLGRIIAAVLMIVGIGCIGSLTSTITALFFHKHEKPVSMKDQMLDTVKNQLEDFDSLTEQDIDLICDALRSIKNINGCTGKERTQECSTEKSKTHD